LNFVNILLTANSRSGIKATTVDKQGFDFSLMPESIDNRYQNICLQYYAVKIL